MYYITHPSLTQSPLNHLSIISVTRSLNHLTLLINQTLSLTPSPTNSVTSHSLLLSQSLSSITHSITCSMTYNFHSLTSSINNSVTHLLKYKLTHPSFTHLPPQITHSNTNAHPSLTLHSHTPSLKILRFGHPSLN